MPAIDLTIVDDVTVAPPWPEVRELDEEGFLVHLPDATWRVALLGEGMSSGLPSVALRLELPDGRTVIAETSVALWSSVTIAARARWPVAFAGGPLEVTEP